MQFASVDKRTTISITLVNAKDPYAGYVLRVEVRKLDDSFSGVNTEFKPAFENFLRTREGSVALDATEDSRLEFFRWNAKGDVGIRYTVSKYIYEGDPLEVFPVAVSGTFKLDGEFVNEMASQLLKLLDA